MIKKILIGHFLLFHLAIAHDNILFQSFENEYNLGYSFEQGGLINGNYSQSSYLLQSLNIEVERLFNNNIWLDANINLVTNYSQDNLGNLNGGNGSGSPFGQNPFMSEFKVRLGYAFELINDKLQLTPYGFIGRTSNWSTSTLLSNDNQNLTRQFFYTGGIAARLNYIIINPLLVYVDQAYTYNWDNSGAIKNIQSNDSLYGKSFAATNYEFTSTIGLLYNAFKNLQLGINFYWTNYQPQSNIAGIIYTPTNIYGSMITVGLTY